MEWNDACVEDCAWKAVRNSQLQYRYTINKCKKAFNSHGFTLLTRLHGIHIQCQPHTLHLVYKLWHTGIRLDEPTIIVEGLAAPVPPRDQLKSVHMRANASVSAMAANALLNQQRLPQPSMSVTGDICSGPGRRNQIRWWSTHHDTPLLKQWYALTPCTV